MLAIIYDLIPFILITTVFIISIKVIYKLIKKILDKF